MNESYWAVLSCGTVYYAVQSGLNCWVLKCDHSNESYWAVLSCGSVYYAAQSGLNCWVLKCDHSNKSHSAVLSRDAVYYTSRESLNLLFWSKKKISAVTIHLKALSYSLFIVLLRGCKRWFYLLIFDSKCSAPLLPPPLPPSPPLITWDIVWPSANSSQLSFFLWRICRLSHYCAPRRGAGTRVPVAPRLIRHWCQQSNES